MPGRRGARAGRGWDAIPPRPVADNPSIDDDPPGGEPRRGGRQRGNASARRRRGWPGDPDEQETGGQWLDRLQDGEELADEQQQAGDRQAGGQGFGGRRAGQRAGGRRSGGQRPGARGSGERRETGRQQPELSEPERAREICLRQLAVRPRTRSELAKVLARREISAEVIAEVLDRYDEVGIIDDAAFARAWVSSRHQGRGLARRALANELRQRGVDSEVANEALEAVDHESEAETARALVDRKLRTARGTPDAVFRRMVAMLARKGYSAGVAVGAVKDALAARDAEAAEFAEQIDADAADEEFTT